MKLGRESVTNFFIIVVTVVWVASFVLSITMDDYKPDAGINIALTGVIAILSVNKVRSSMRGGDG